MQESIEKKIESNPEFSARMMAVQACYQMQQNTQPVRGILEEFTQYRKDIRTQEGESLCKPDMAHFKKVIINLDERLEDIEGILQAHLQQGAKKEVELLLKSILLCGVAELLCFAKIDKALIINDYLNITHSFYPQNQVSFVNGILDSVSKIVRV